jgi:diacylglycerol kinase (ATP)
MRIVVILRPPGDDERVTRLLAALESLRAAGQEVELWTTWAAADATRYASEAADGGADLVLVAGGDGTVNEVVNGIAAAERHPRLGIVPLGTANDFARGLGIPPGPLEAVRVAVEGQTLLVDVCRVNRRCFVNVSTGGFGAEATEEAPERVKRHLGPLAYALTGAKKFVRFRKRRARFLADGSVVHDGDFVFFAVGNAPLTGGGVRIAPRAEVSDGKFDVVVVGGVSRLDLVALLPDLRAGTHIESPDVLYLRASELNVESTEPIPVNADGEPMRATSYCYRVLDRPLMMMVPANGRNAARA